MYINRHNFNTNVMTAGKEYTSLKVTKKLTSRLKELGTKGETYEDIIWKLIEKGE
jgi:hypothetical protein